MKVIWLITTNWVEEQQPKTRCGINRDDKRSVKPYDHFYQKETKLLSYRGTMRQASSDFLRVLCYLYLTKKREGSPNRPRIVFIIEAELVGKGRRGLGGFPFLFFLFFLFFFYFLSFFFALFCFWRFKRLSFFYHSSKRKWQHAQLSCQINYL